MNHPLNLENKINHPFKRISKLWIWIGISIILQITLALFLGHAYDMRISMATGYLVGTGQNPYVPQNLVSIFHDAIFQEITSIGYPPPWPILLGAIYLLSFNLIRNLFIYNLAIKIPIIVTNILLVFLVSKILYHLKASEKSIQKARVFLLFNPFLLLTTSAWGQIEPIVASFVILSFLMLDVKKYAFSSFLLGMAIAFKPIALPILPVVLLFLLMNYRQAVLRYILITILTIFALCVAPFLIFGWDPTIIIQHWNAQMSMTGGLSWVTALLPLNLAGISSSIGWAIGFLWVPALGIASWFLRRKVKDFTDLVKISVGMVLLFYVTRTWLSEPNINLILPLIVILVSIGEIPRVKLSLVWILPLTFSLFNTALFQLLFLSAPTLMAGLFNIAADSSSIRKFILTTLSILWLIFASLMIRVCFKSPIFNKTIAQTSQET